jgi:hypothetical protein
MMRDNRRHIRQRQLRSLDLLTLLAITVLVPLLAGCGAAPMSGTVTTSGSPAPTATVVKYNSATPQGCPSGQSPIDAASFTPDVIVTQDARAAGTAQPVVLAPGQRLEIRLQPMFTWELKMSGAGNALAVTGPQGWYDASLKMCVWRFTAAGAGKATLAFDGDVVCPPLKLCPSMEQSVAYRVTVL